MYICSIDCHVGTDTTEYILLITYYIITEYISVQVTRVNEEEGRKKEA